MKLLFIISYFFFPWHPPETINGITISKNASVITIENKNVSIKYDLKKGSYSAFDKSTKTEAIYNASTQVNELKSSDKEAIHSFTTEAIHESIGKGAALLITSKKKNAPDQLLRIKLYDNKGFVVLQSGIKNSLKQAYKVMKFSPLASASVFKGLNLKENFRLLDGEGGGIETYIRKEPGMLSQNNMLLNFGSDINRHTLVAGGLTYNEFEKLVSVSEERERTPDLVKLAPGLRLIEYIDFGNATSSKPKFADVDKFEFKTKFKFAGSFTEAKSIIYDTGDIKIDLKKLDRTKTYTFGIIWGSNYATQKQSLILSTNGNEKEWLPPSLLPDLSTGSEPDIYFMSITPELMKGGMPAIIIRKNGGANTVVGEAVLFEGKLPEEMYLIPIKAPKAPSEFRNVRMDMYAEDPVGKQVDPGQTYLPEKDAFFFDISTANPLDAAEKYAQTVKKVQAVKLNAYYFPTICLWVAMQPLYGGQGDKSTRAVNDAPGAVDEMIRVKNSGWLKYTKMGIRLVPDCYAENNENGWWDDAHWQRYGSGSVERQGTTEMTLPGAHYRPPYETSKKWAQKVIELGGLPFFYFQTGVRSKDYAEQFPQHMLHNQSYFKYEGKADGLNNNLGTYDFTDTGFVAHMKNVYKNLNDAGIAGMMFDYPYTAWAPYGGMEDKYSTTAGMYRKVFELATTGLGNKSYVQERNIRRGSEIAMGFVQSQRTWGDNDILTPEMVMRTGLRWYKNRVLFNYDMDAKSLSRALPADSDDGVQKLLTMSYVAASRLLLGQSFARTTPENVFKLSRVFPYHKAPQSARPIDAFSSDYPRVYDFKVNEKWHQLTFFNEDDNNTKTVSINLFGTPGFGGMGLPKNSSYYVYDFWNHQFVGLLKSDAVLTQNLRKGEARMMSVRLKENHPQVLSTDRHIMQGYLELSDVSWDGNRLSGKAEMVEHEPMKIIIATNGKVLKNVKFSQGVSSVKMLSDGLMELSITSSTAGKAVWWLQFK